jgi:glycosyltransferase involved in cell wall biosynthesis
MRVFQCKYNIDIMTNQSEETNLAQSAPRIAVVIPAYHALSSIAKVVRKIPPTVGIIIIVADDTREDLTPVLRELGDSRVHLVAHQQNQGVGGATLTGYGCALQLGADIVVKIDSDDQMDLNYFDDLVAPLIDLSADYTKGNRFLHQEELRSMPIIRRIGNQGLSFLTKLATGYWKIYDPTNGYTAISRRALELLDPGMISRNFFFETSMLAELHKLDAVVWKMFLFRHLQRPCRCDPNSTGIFPFSIQSHLSYFRAHIRQYFRFDFSAVSFYLLSSLILGLFGVVWGIVKWIRSDQTGIPATTGTVLIAVLPIILAVQFFVQAVALDIASPPTIPLASRRRRKVAHPLPLVTRFTQLVDSGQAQVISL